MAALDYKADWPALVETAGLRTWSQNINPMPFALGEEEGYGLYGALGFCANSCHFPLDNIAKYEEATLAKDFKALLNWFP